MKGKIYVGIFLLLFPTVLFAQYRAKVLDQDTKEVLNEVLVSIPELQLRFWVEENGTFNLVSVPNGLYYVQFDRKGYERHVEQILIPLEKDWLVLLSKGSQKMPEILVQGSQLNENEESPTSVEEMSNEEMRQKGALTLTDGLSKMPGVSQMSTGPGISKPVLRGLYGNRIQVVMFGQRFDNQQFQDEHGLGLSDVGVDRVEIIKGPATLLYGPEAMGGVIHILEEKPAAINRSEAELSTRFFSNTSGIATDFGFKKSNEKWKFRFRAGFDSHADYLDGNQQRVLNSRFNGYFVKTGLTYRRQKFMSSLDYSFALNNFGFILEASTTNLPADERQSRTFQMPHHTVFLNTVSSQNSWFLPKGKLKWNVGIQVNDRQEQEGGNKISLDMLLTSLNHRLAWEYNPAKNSNWVLGTQGFWQRNLNLGSRSIIPDANLSNAALFLFNKCSLGKFHLEGGVRGDFNSIRSFETGTINTGGENPGIDIRPFDRNYFSGNAAFGVQRKWGRLNWKSNLSTGFRPGNLAELSSNGLHEGTIRYEIGNPNLKIERNFCADVNVDYSTKWLDFGVSGYINRFLDYIYLTPTKEEYIGFDIYRFQQENAELRGFESYLNFHPEKLSWMSIQASYAYTHGQTDAGAYLPFIPAQKATYTLRLNGKKESKWDPFFVELEVVQVLQVTLIAQFETPTANYNLFNARAGYKWEGASNTLTLNVVGNNLTNELYFDHLSRFKYFGIYNMGQNWSLNLKWNFYGKK